MLGVFEEDFICHFTFFAGFLKKFSFDFCETIHPCDARPLSALTNLLTVQAETKPESRSSQDSLERLKAELETDLACVRAVVEEVVGDSDQDNRQTVAELANLPAGSRHGVGRKLSLPPLSEVEAKSLLARKTSAVSPASPEAEKPPTKAPSLSPPPVTAGPGSDGEERSLGARPRYLPNLRSEERETSGGGGGGAVLTQNSWASRARRLNSVETSGGGEANHSASPVNTNSFLRRKDLWERRSMTNPAEEKASPGWGSRTTPRVHKTSNQTPDLVMDLPTGPLAASPPIPAPRPVKRSPSSDSSSSSSSAEVPARNTTSADTFAADTDTMRKHSHKSSTADKAPSSPSNPSASPVPVFRTNILATAAPASTPAQAKSKSLFSTPSSSSKPAVKVKPILHVKPSENKKDPPPPKDS